jgi:hypothetical protein
MFDRRNTKAETHINPHQFRDNFPHQWLVNGGQEGDLMQLRGWSSP